MTFLKSIILSLFFIIADCNQLGTKSSFNIFLTGNGFIVFPLNVCWPVENNWNQGNAGKLNATWLSTDHLLPFPILPAIKGLYSYLSINKLKYHRIQKNSKIISIQLQQSVDLSIPRMRDSMKSNSCWFGFLMYRKEKYIWHFKNPFRSLNFLLFSSKWTWILKDNLFHFHLFT